MPNPFRPWRVATLLSMSLAAAGASAQTTLQPVVVRAVASFDFDRIAVGAEDRAKLLADVAKLSDVTWQQVIATGHTDSVGRDDYNDRLSARRAAAVKAYLVAQGLDAAMIRVVGQGEAAPVADNASASGRARNRRTEVEFRGVRGAPRQ